jgi:hypothetical protein
VSIAVRSETHKDRFTVENSFVLGVTKPTALNSGLAVHGLTANDLTPISGDLDLHDADFGTDAEFPGMGVIRGKKFNGFPQVTPTTRELVYADCLFPGRTFTYTPGVDQPPANAVAWSNVPATGPINPVHFYYCTANPVQPSYGLNGFGGAALGTVYRCDVSRVEDGLYYFNYPGGQTPWMKALGTYIHHLTFWTNDPQRAGDSPAGYTHNDGGQCPGSRDGIWEGCNVEAFVDPTSGNPSAQFAIYPNGVANSCLMMTISTGPHQNLTIRNNWFSGGIDAHVAMPDQATKTWRTLNTWTITNNRVDPSMKPSGGAGNWRYTFFYCGEVLGPQPTDVTGTIFAPDGGTNVPAGLAGTSTGIASLDYAPGAKILTSYISTTRLPGT